MVGRMMEPSAVIANSKTLPSVGSTSTDPLSVRSALVVAFYGLTLLLVNFGQPWALTFHEVNFAGPAREFLQSGDWLVPRIMGMPIWDKPPLMHWSIAASLLVFDTEAEWAARLPAMVSAVLTSLVIAWLAARWYGDRVGLLAGLIQSSSVYVFMQGRLAEADMMLCAIVTMAMAAFAAGVLDRNGDRPPIGWRLAYFGAAGLAFLVKGPVGLVLVAVGSGLFAIAERKWLAWRLLLDPIGWMVMLALVVAWPAAAMLREPGLLDVWWRHNVERFSGDLGGGGKDPMFYGYTSAWLALPWTPLAIFGALTHAKSVRAQKTSDPRGRFLLCWTFGMMLVLSLSAWKHKHYIIPALPPLSIWAALGLIRIMTGAIPDRLRHWPIARISRLTMPLLGLLGIVGVLGLAASGRSGLPLAGASIATLVGLGLTITDRLWHAGQPRAAVAGTFAVVWGAFVLVQSLAMPEVDDYRGQSELATRFSAELPPDADLSVVGIPDPQITYYLPIPVRRHDDVASFADRLVIEFDSDEERVYVVGPQWILDDLEHLGRVRLLDRATSIHPRKGEPDRMLALELRPDRTRLASKTRPH
ncbi:ArnT family glycosyltransferase [Tautonia rosea]|uniref:ArnT family glycosyltransferase n=1 Tax=Tautonia rosea TaxID=2728037 RepID=UPI0014735715|nr:glycosyltransferase family 39 protein [Tautonia rosea]